MAHSALKTIFDSWNPHSFSNSHTTQKKHQCWCFVVLTVPAVTHNDFTTKLVTHREFTAPSPSLTHCSYYQQILEHIFPNITSGLHSVHCTARDEDNDHSTINASQSAHNTTSVLRSAHNTTSVLRSAPCTTCTPYTVIRTSVATHEMLKTSQVTRKFLTTPPVAHTVLTITH